MGTQDELSRLKKGVLPEFIDESVEKRYAVEWIGGVLAEDEMLAQPPGIGVLPGIARFELGLKAKRRQESENHVFILAKVLERDAEGEAVVLMAMAVELKDEGFAFVFQFKLEVWVI